MQYRKQWNTISIEEKRWSQIDGTRKIAEGKKKKKKNGWAKFIITGNETYQIKHFFKKYNIKVVMNKNNTLRIFYAIQLKKMKVITRIMSIKSNFGIT